MVIDRRPETLRHVFSASTGESFEGDESLIYRIMNAFVASTQDMQDLGESDWNIIANMKAEIARALLRHDFEAAATLLRNPAKANLFYGFDHAFAETPGDSNYFASSALDGLCRFAEAVGAIPTDNPEYYGLREMIVYEADDVLQAIDKTIGWDFSVPIRSPQKMGPCHHFAEDSVCPLPGLES